MATAYPKTMYNVNATVPTKVVNSEAEEKSLGPDWKDTPQGAKYPKAKYHETLEPRLVHSEAEEKALSGWHDKPFEKKDPNEKLQTARAPEPDKHTKEVEHEKNKAKSAS